MKDNELDGVEADVLCTTSASASSGSKDPAEADCFAFTTIGLAEFDQLRPEAHGRAADDLAFNPEGRGALSSNAAPKIGSKGR